MLESGLRLNHLLSRIFLPALLLAASQVAPAADQNQLDASEPLFTVMAAINAVGFNSGLATSPPIRKQVREFIAARHPSVLPELREAYAAAAYRRSDTEILTEFLSLGLSLKAAPGFEWRVREVEIPPAAMALDHFRVLLPRFYQEAGIAELWKRSQGAIEAELARYQPAVIQTVTEVNAYVRNPGFGYLGRHFQVYFDMLTPPNVVQTRSYADDYFVVISPSNEPRVQDIRHAYLYFLMDPLGTKYGMDLKEKSSLAAFAAAAPALGENFKEDFVLLSVASLVKAIESRMTHNPAMVEQALLEGYILTPYFAEQLAVYEKQPESMKLFFPRMVSDISVRKENKRLSEVKFAPAPAPRSVVATTNTAVSGSVASRTLESAEDTLYQKKDLETARSLYQKSLDQPGEAEEHARAYFGLARIALQQKDLDRAEQLFKKTLESSPDDVTRGWSQYYLGQMAMNQNPPDPAEAGRRFRETIALAGANPKTRELAQKALDQLPKP